MNRKYLCVPSSRGRRLPPMWTKIEKSGIRRPVGADVPTWRLRFIVQAMTIALFATLGSTAQAQPQGGVVSAGTATIESSAGQTTITQSTAKTAINWDSFSIGSGGSVEFIQPGSSSVALNRVTGSNPSEIMGSLSANGQVFLLNPNGVLFGTDAQVNVGGLVASTLGLSDSDFMAGRYRFSGAGDGSVVNRGSINATDGGYIAMLGANVSNEGVLVAKLGTIALAAGNAVTLDLAGDGLLNVTLNQGVADALVENSGNIAADGGFVLMSTQAAGQALQGVVNNTGVVQARTIENRNGTIMLMGDMERGTINVAGTLDASAPDGGDGGFIETSAAKVKVADSVFVTTQSETGTTGMWLIDPPDYTIGSAEGDDIAGSTLSATLVTTSVTIRNTEGSREGDGNIIVNDAIEWTTSGPETTLFLFAENDVNVNADITATEGNLVVCCGRDVNVNASITTTRGSVLLGAVQNINMSGTMTATDGNIAMCAGNNINITGAMTVTNGSTDPNQSLGLPRGLTLLAGLNGTGPGSGSGTVSITSSITNTNAPATIYYNPTSYDVGTGVFAGNFIGSAPDEIMWVYPEVEDKVFDGTTTATLIGLRGDFGVIDVSLVDGGTANFNNASVGNNKTVTFTGFSLDGAAADDFAFTDAGGLALGLVDECCNFTARTTGNIIAGATPPDEPTPTEPTPTEPTPTERPTPTPPPVTPEPSPGTVPPTRVPGTVSTTVPEIVAATLPVVAFSPPTVVPAVYPNLVSAGIRMPPPNELVQIEMMQPEVMQREIMQPQVVPPRELAPKPDRN